MTRSDDDHVGDSAELAAQSHLASRAAGSLEQLSRDLRDQRERAATIDDPSVAAATAKALEALSAEAEGLVVQVRRLAGMTEEEST
ncbi:hypothetical protein G9U51_12550 [Calidifontibacter sp. DB0510]|uniref:Uncharacterized protein n=1 Tax=Metallococcus carri TaxID=1656884 RepID=A0A967EAU6_9MICO|nr:hypothetical protein [Metallococcus carri]NHN56610.1 hypothetical protein [Metallococcus carri]NOP38909.1 hypothetical protein [Calidifontibacter sp. DB2511S]